MVKDKGGLVWCSPWGRKTVEQDLAIKQQQQQNLVTYHLLGVRF